MAKQVNCGYNNYYLYLQLSCFPLMDFILDTESYDVD